MYTRIIQMIRKRYSSKVEWSRIERMFRWVRTACRPLHVQELHHALGITVYSETEARCKTIHKPRLIARFGHVLGIMSGALIEIDDSRTVRFIHASMMDFLDQNNHCPSRNADDQIFNLHSAEANCQSALDCLTYIQNLFRLGLSVVHLACDPRLPSCAGGFPSSSTVFSSGPTMPRKP